MLKGRFAFQGASNSEFYVIVTEIEGGGRGIEPVAEHRIQLRIDDTWAPKLSSFNIATNFINAEDKTGKECYLIGIYRPEANSEEVLCAFYPSSLLPIENRSLRTNKSVQIKIDTIQNAYLHGFGIQEKSNKNNIVAFKPKFFLWYMENRDKLHLQDIKKARQLGNAFSSSPIHGLNIIYYGAPGTGKSHQVDKKTNDDNSIRTTFHPDTDYSSFIGCYKPIEDTDENGKKLITYSFVPQAFLKAYTKAWKNKSEPFYLVIEEINRGNCAQIFGDIFQLLDRADDGFSRYSVTPESEIEKFLKEDSEIGFAALDEDNFQDVIDKEGKVIASAQEIKEGKRLVLPPNLHILATMNTSDQSLFPIDSAFKRRWDWEYIPIDYAPTTVTPFVIKVGNETYDWGDFIKAVNKLIEKLTSSEDKQLGYFFVTPQEGNVITEAQFVSKVVFYLWSDIYKDYYGRGNSIFSEIDGVDFSSFNKFFGNEDNSKVANAFIKHVFKLEKDLSDKTKQS